MPRKRDLPYAVWTPTGEVLCPACAGFSPRYPYDDEPVTDLGVVTCDHCATYLVIDSKLAAEQRVCKRLDSAGYRRATLSQTGGMCSAVVVPLPHLDDADDPASGGYIMVTAAEEDPRFYNVGFYDNDTRYDGDYDDLGRWNVPYREVVAAVRSIVTATGGAA